MTGIILCIYAILIIVSAVIIANVCIKLFKDDNWRRNIIIIWWPKPKNRCTEKEPQLQQESDAKKESSEPSPSVFNKFINTRITLQDVHDYVKQYPPLGQIQCTGCHIACKDDCDHTCSGKCTTVCNNSCKFACVGVCGGGCSGEATTTIGTNEF